MYVCVFIYIYTLGVCDIEKKRYLDIFGDLFDNNN